MQRAGTRLKDHGGDLSIGSCPCKLCKTLLCFEEMDPLLLMTWLSTSVRLYIYHLSMHFCNLLIGSDSRMKSSGWLIRLPTGSHGY